MSAIKIQLQLCLVLAGSFIFCETISAQNARVPTIPYTVPAASTVCNDPAPDYSDYPDRARLLYYGDMYSRRDLVSGDPIRIAFEAGYRGRKVTVYIYHASGGFLPASSSTITPGPVNTLLYQNTFDGGCRDRVDRSFNFTNTCNRYGLFKIVFVVERRKSDVIQCDNRDTEVYCTVVVILPRLIPTPSDDLFQTEKITCAGGYSILTVPSDVPGQNGVYWYHTQGNPSNPYSQLFKPNSPGFAENSCAPEKVHL